MDVMEGWHDFFVATVGAAAALAGLIIVAISVNIKDIIAFPSMISRAGATVASCPQPGGHVADAHPGQPHSAARAGDPAGRRGRDGHTVNPRSRSCGERYRLTRRLDQVAIAVVQVLPFGSGQPDRRSS